MGLLYRTDVQEQSTTLVQAQLIEKKVSICCLAKNRFNNNTVTILLNFNNYKIL